MGRSVSSTTSPLYATLTAGEAITAGDVIAYEPATNQAFYADDTILHPLWRPSTIYNQSIVSPFQVNSGTAATYSPPVQCATLSNGNIVIAWNSTYWIKFKIVAPNGTQVVGVTNGATISSGYNTIRGWGIAALSGGGFVIARGEYGLGTVANQVKVTGFSNAGAATIAEFLFNQLSSTGTSMVDAKICATGTGFAVSSVDYGSSYVFSALYNASGTIQGSIGTASIGANNLGTSYAQTSLTAAPGGGYLIGYAGNSYTYYTQYDNTGTSTGATLICGSNGNSYGSNVSFCVLSGGAVVGMTAVPNTTSGTLWWAGNISLTSTVRSQNYLAGVPFEVAALTGGTALCAFTSTAGLSVAWTDTNGNHVDKAVIDSTITATGVQVRVYATANGNAVVYALASSKILMYQVSPVGALIAGPTTIDTTVTPSSSAPAACNVTNTGASGSFVVYTYNNASLYGTEVLLGPLNPRYVYGVANASAAQGASVSVQLTGSASTRVSFTPQTVNCSLNSGNTIQLSGTLANLSGLSTPNNRGRQQPSGVFGNGNVQYIAATSTFTVPAKVVRVRVWGGGGSSGGSGGTTSFGSYVSATGGSLSNTSGVTAGTGSGGDINTTGGLSAGVAYSGGAGAANYFGNGGVTSANGPTGAVAANGGNGMFGQGGAAGTNITAGGNATLPLGTTSIPIDYIGAGAAGGATTTTAGYTVGGNGVNGGGGAGSGNGTSSTGAAGWPGASGANGSTNANINAGGGFALKSISNLTVGSTVAVTVGSGGAASGTSSAGAAGLVVVEW